MNIICNYELTKHASCRAQQRGIKRKTLAFVIGFADTWLHAGEGHRTVRISQKQLSKLSREGIPASLIERAMNVVVVIDPVAGVIITVLHDIGSKNGRRYRTQWPTRSQKWRRSHRRRERANRGRHFPHQIRFENETIH